MVNPAVAAPVPPALSGGGSRVYFEAAPLQAVVARTAASGSANHFDGVDMGPSSQMDAGWAWTLMEWIRPATR